MGKMPPAVAGDPFPGDKSPGYKRRPVNRASWLKPEVPSRLQPQSRRQPAPFVARAFMPVFIGFTIVACGPPPAEVERDPVERDPVETPAEAEPKAPVETRSRVDRAVATTGDVITYTVIVDHDPGYQVELPETGADIAGFRIIDVGSEDPREEGGRRILERWYKLRADLVGSYVLPPVEVAFRPVGDVETATEASAEAGAGDEAPFETVQTSEIFIEVQSVLPEDGEVTDIRGLKPLREVATPIPWWLWAAAGAGAMLLALLGAWLWRRGRRKIEPPPRPAHEIAFEALARLRETDFEDPEAMRRFHFEISEVVRAYVENRFTLNATDLTTEEITAMLDEVRDLAGDDSELLRRFLTATDQVKFAAHEPSEEEIEGTYEGALSFVEATRERPEAATADPATAQEAPAEREAA